MRDITPKNILITEVADLLEVISINYLIQNGFDIEITTL